MVDAHSFLTKAPVLHLCSPTLNYSHSTVAAAVAVVVDVGGGVGVVVVVNNSYNIRNLNLLHISLFTSILQ
jgi:hypothetical protein